MVCISSVFLYRGFLFAKTVKMFYFYLKNIFMAKVIINAKGSVELKEALRKAAIHTRKNGENASSSAYLVAVLEKDPVIKKFLKNS